VSHSSYNDGARSVIRRSVATKTVVQFDRADIDNLFLQRADLGDLFSEKLRDAYDYLTRRPEVASLAAVARQRARPRIPRRHATDINSAQAVTTSRRSTLRLVSRMCHCQAR
jgi:hypothetical protein